MPGVKKRQTGEGAAYEKALSLLEYRARSRAELRRRLETAGFAGEEIERALERLAACGLLDDRRFALELARSLGAGRGYGPRRVSFELSHRGIEPELAAEILVGAYGEETAAERVRRLVEKKFGPAVFTGEDPRLLARARRFLLARGWEPDTVSEVLGG